MAEGSKSIVLRPHKWSFILLGSSVLLFVILMIFSAIAALFHNAFWIIFIVMAIFALIVYFVILVVYKKEEYIIEGSKIIRNYGGVFSDNSLEIKLDKVTEVSAILGFVQNTIFGTGTLVIKTAGSSSSRIVLRNISESIEIYKLIQQQMQRNGYHLQQDTLVQEEKPHILGIFGEVLQGIGSFFIFLLIIGVNLIMGEGEKLPSEFTVELESLLNVFGLVLGVVLLLILGLIITFKYLDLRRRKYQIFTDSIVYTEGFLTKHYSILPMERVSDSANRQSFFSKLFGLHDVLVSSEGSNSNVVFKNMVNGGQMIKNIKYLKNEITRSDTNLEQSEEKQQKSIDFTDEIEKAFTYNKAFEADYKMDPVKTLVSAILVVVLFIICIVIFGLESIQFLGIPFLILIVPALKSIPELLFTTYSVENSSIDSKYQFLSNTHNSFSVDKITKVYFKESLLDMILGTCSVYFYSIGSSSSLVFKNIKKREGLQKNILEKVGIYEQEEKKRIPINFSIGNYAKANIGIAILLGVILFMFLLPFFLKNMIVGVELNQYDIIYFVGIIGSLILLFGMNFIYKKLYYSKRFYRQKLAQTYFESIRGILCKISEFTRIDNIKGIKVTKYPLSATGDLQLNISGEVVVKNKKNNQALSFNNLNIGAAYVDNIFALHKYLDGVLVEKKLDTAVRFESGQDIGNSLLITIVLFLLFAVSAFMEHLILGCIVSVVFILILGLQIWSIKVKKYSIETDRIMSAWGIIYKSRQSIVFKKFNFIEKNQGFLGKIFRNGKLSIYTLGSGSVDMRMSDVDKFHEMYEMLKN